MRSKKYMRDFIPFINILAEAAVRIGHDENQEARSLKLKKSIIKQKRIPQE